MSHSDKYLIIKNLSLTDFFVTETEIMDCAFRRGHGKGFLTPGVETQRVAPGLLLCVGATGDLISTTHSIPCNLSFQSSR